MARLREPDSDRQYESSEVSLLWRVVRHTCFVLLGMGLALVVSSILGNHEGAALLLLMLFPSLLKALALIGCFGFFLILIESFK
jgi:hypothetical protein